MTQNFVSSVNLGHVLRFLATRSQDLISGCAKEDRETLHARFVAALEANCPQASPSGTWPLSATIHHGQKDSRPMLRHPIRCLYESHVGEKGSWPEGVSFVLGRLLA